MQLKNKDKFEEKKFITTSIIRLMSMTNCNTKSFAMMAYTSLQLKNTENNGGVMTDEKIYEQYIHNLELIGGQN